MGCSAASKAPEGCSAAMPLIDRQMFDVTDALIASIHTAAYVVVHVVKAAA